MNTKKKRQWAIDAALRGELSPDELMAEEQSEYSDEFLKAMETPTPQERAFFTKLRKGDEPNKAD